MTDTVLQDTVLTVTDPAWAQVLLDPRESAFYTPFLGQDCTVSEAARLGGVSVNTAYVRVRRLLKLGLLRVSGQRQRAGRAVKLYRMVAERFFVPYEVTPHESYAALLFDYLDLPSARALKYVLAAVSGFRKGRSIPTLSQERISVLSRSTR